MRLPLARRAARRLKSSGDSRVETLSGRCLRLLATNYIFREVSPDVFANNRQSLALDTKKDAPVLAEEPYVQEYAVNQLMSHS